ncbi:MAG: GNAT family N-acetyltransferase [Pontibacterium sp.]
MIKIELLQDIRQVESATWNGLLTSDYPFLNHHFLSALEHSGCVGAATGWHPIHLMLVDEDDDQERKLLGVMPLYLKTHSYGEYVFDWSWADAYHQQGMEYYPKLLNAIPFTPATGPRFATQLDEQQFMGLLSQAIPALCEQLEASSWHSLFVPKTTQQLAHPKQLATRTDCQYHWFNRDFKHFDDFLATCMSRKRKNIKKERAKVSQQGVSLRRFSGAELTAEHIETFYPFYQNTYQVRGQKGYLNLAFFQQLVAKMADQMVLFLAYCDDKPVAGALCFKDSQTLYGRYWGCLEDFDALHFETCYYQGIEYCIEHGLQRFDPGAQGEHKISRGFEPSFTHSLHFMRHPGMHEAVHNFVNEEAALVRANAATLAEGLPFKREANE